MYVGDTCMHYKWQRSWKTTCTQHNSDINVIVLTSDALHYTCIHANSRCWRFSFRTLRHVPMISGSLTMPWYVKYTFLLLEKIDTCNIQFSNPHCFIVLCAVTSHDIIPFWCCIIILSCNCTSLLCHCHYLLCV